MSTVTRCEPAEISTMEPLADGGFIQSTYRGALWRCEGCGLVWTRRAQAEGCERRGHVSAFEDGPYGVRAVVNNVPVGHLHYFTRRAVRRDPVAGLREGSA